MAKLKNILKETGKGIAKTSLAVGSAILLPATCAFIPEAKEFINYAPSDSIVDPNLLYNSVLTCTAVLTGNVLYGITGAKNFYKAGKAFRE